MAISLRPMNTRKDLQDIKFGMLTALNMGMANERNMDSMVKIYGLYFGHRTNKWSLITSRLALAVYARYPDFWGLENLCQWGPTEVYVL